MTMIIKKLTPEQEAMIPVIRNEFITYGLSTEPVDWKIADESMNDAYISAGFAPPKIILHFISPYEGCIAANVLNDKKFMEKNGNLEPKEFIEAVKQGVEVLKLKKNAKKYIYSSGYGQHDSNWISFYYFFIKVCGIKTEKNLEPLIRLTKSAGRFWTYKDIAIITDRHELVKFDNENRLHCEDGPSIRYRDGFSVYCWHGVRIPSEWIEDKASLTPSIAIKWANIEQRRCAMEILGWVNVIRQLNGKVIDKDDDPEIGELIEVEIPDIGKEKFLHVLCGTKREFAIPVPPEMKTALEAQSWTWSLDVNDFILPEIRT
jgi:hypothetical protein